MSESDDSKSVFSTSQKIVELILKINNIKESEIKLNKITAFGEVEKELAKIDSDLNKYESAIDSMIDNKIKIDNIESISYIDQITNDYEKSFQKNSDSIETFTESGTRKVHIARDYIPQCKILDRELDNTLLLSWKNWVYKKLPENLNSKVINTLSRVAKSDLKPQVSVIEEKLNEIDNIATVLPNELNVNHNLDEKVRSVKNLWDEMIDSKTDFNQIIQFLRDALEEDGAKYEGFTPEIKAWFEEHGEMRNARIKFNN